MERVQVRDEGRHGDAQRDQPLSARMKLRQKPEIGGHTCCNEAQSSARRCRQQRCAFEQVPARRIPRRCRRTGTASGAAAARSAPGTEQAARTAAGGAAHARISGDLSVEPRQDALGRNIFRHQGHLRPGRHAARDDFRRADRSRRQTEDHLHAGGVDEPAPPHLYRRPRSRRRSRRAAELQRLFDRQMARYRQRRRLRTLEVETRYMQGPRLFDPPAFRCTRTTRRS